MRGTCFFGGMEKIGWGGFERMLTGREPEFGVVATSQWLRCGSFPLAGLLLGRGKIFTPPAGVVR